MKKHPVRHFFTNLICGFIPNKIRRRKVRVILDSNVISDINMIRKNIGEPVRKVKLLAGYRGINLIIAVNDKWVFKFPFKHGRPRDTALREERILRIFGPKSTIPTPACELIEFKGDLVRKYSFVHGLGYRQFTAEQLKPHIHEYGTILGRFIFELAEMDPPEIADLKATHPDTGVRIPNTTPGFMRGWCHNDISDNFMIDPQTMKIVGIIDWEDAQFKDFTGIFDVAQADSYREIMRVAKQEYTKLYNKKHKTNFDV